MKIIQKLFFTLIVFFHTISPLELALTPKNTISVDILTPENTILSFDIDNVVIETSGWIKPKIFLGGIWYNPFNTINYIHTLLNLKDANKRDTDGIKKALFDDYGNPINGMTFQLLYQGMRDPLFTPYAPWMLETIESSRNFIDGTHEIIKYLQKKGYTIVFATNKDHVSYDLTAQALGKKFTSLATKAFVAQPGNAPATLAQLQKFAQQPTTDKNYKRLERKARIIQPTETVVHVPSTKPNVEYFQYMEKIIGPDKNIVFIDDREDNVDGFNKLQETSSALRHGIQFKNAKQLAQELIKLGILSIEDDKKFLVKKGMYKNIPSVSQQAHAN